MDQITEGSDAGANTNTGTSVFSSLFQLSAFAGMNMTNFYGKVATITLALEKLTDVSKKNIVLLSDLKVA